MSAAALSHAAWTGPASAHLARIAFRAGVGGDITAVVGVSAVAVDGGISTSVAGEFQRAAVDGKAAVGINTVAGRDNGKRSSINDNKAVRRSSKLLLPRTRSAKAGTVRAARRVNTVIHRSYVERTAIDGNRQALDPFIAIRDRKRTVLNRDGSI